LEGKPDLQKEKKKKTLPKGTFNRNTLLFFLNKELSRARRYKIPFSAITFSIVNVTPKKSILPGFIKRDEIKNAVLRRLVKIVRDTDLVGILDENKICVLLSMTPEQGSKLAIRRILKAFHSEPFIINDIPLMVKLAAISVSFHRERTATLKDFFKAIETEMNTLIKPLKSWFLLDESKGQG
jgi:PleD family two-component response regulator